MARAARSLARACVLTRRCGRVYAGVLDRLRRGHDAAYVDQAVGEIKTALEAKDTLEGNTLVLKLQHKQQNALRGVLLIGMGLVFAREDVRASRSRVDAALRLLGR